ncbi:hypothetical protein BV25DRAFT_1820692 [Artomyces pyxidatus]|uniref:Uncharacterized protein n=1 Tax=Artomyces pyxidatus TaxID=48021 RepID=A0ACB8TE02_9AGAM|nr:hypothetical protein BV25DRAFT_1820692 [Artomyces pyxidatus]
MRFLSSSILLSALCLCLQCIFAVANTEIVNFEVSFNEDLFFPHTSNWTVFKPGAHEQPWTLLPAPLHTLLDAVCEKDVATERVLNCSHELWLVLDLDDANWRTYSKFTLRISWPASSPVDFSIRLYTPSDYQTYLTGQPSRRTDPSHSSASSVPQTRRRYVRVRAVDTGVRTPSHASDNTSSSTADQVSFIVIAEPLYFGVFPASVSPVLVWLAVIVGVASMIVPTVNRYLGRIAAMAQTEMEGTKEREKDS